MELADVDIPLDLAPISRSPGRKRKPCEQEFVRALTLADRAMLENREPRERTEDELPRIKRLSMRHHALARAIASGMKLSDAAITVGYEYSHVRILNGDPAFQELLSFYKEDIDRQLIDMHERLSGLSVEAVEELRGRLEEDPEDFTNGQLLEIVSRTTDRTGYGPQSTSTQVNVNVDLATRLAAARERVREEENTQIIDITPEKEPNDGI